jgi:hypothetical protein
MITIKNIAGIAAILLPLAAGAAYAQSAPTPSTPGASPPGPSTPGTAPGSAAPPGATKTPDAGMAKLQAACKTDIEKYCGDSTAAAKKPTAGAAPAAKQAPEQLVACMTTNEAKLSAPCKTAWTERKASTKGNPS